MLSIRDTLKPYIVAYVAIAVFLWYIKPNVMFYPDGRLRPFGTGYEKTILYYPIVLIFIAILLFFIHQKGNLGSLSNPPI